MITRFYKIYNNRHEVVYVGLTTRSVQQRFNEHMKFKKLDPRQYSVEEFYKVDHGYIKNLEDYYVAKDTAALLERKFIRSELRAGSKLLNISGGGEWNSKLSVSLLKTGFFNKNKTITLEEYLLYIRNYQVWLLNWVHNRGIIKYKFFLQSWIQIRSRARYLTFLKSWILHKIESKYKIWLHSFVKCRTHKQYKKWLNTWFVSRSMVPYKKWLFGFIANRIKSIYKRWLSCWCSEAIRNKYEKYLHHWISHRESVVCKDLIKRDL